MKHYWLVIMVILSVVLVLGSCTGAPRPDTTPPPAITGLIAIDAYDGRVNLWWDRSTARDFDHYNVYVSKSEVTDVTTISFTRQIGDISTNSHQLTGLEDGTDYYLAVTAVDKSGNEDKRVVSVRAKPTSMARGTVDPDIQVDVYQSDVAWPGTTLLADNHNTEKPRITEVNMRGGDYLGIPSSTKSQAIYQSRI